MYEWKYFAKMKSTNMQTLGELRMRDTAIDELGY